MNRKVLSQVGSPVLACASALALVACGRGYYPTVPPPSPPTDFAAFVNQQVQTAPSLSDSTPADTSVLTNHLVPGDPAAFAGVTFGSGDALPSGTNQASVACAQAGQAACNASVSADPNSGLN